MKCRFLLLFGMILLGFSGMAQTAVQGKIKDKSNNEPLIGAVVALLKNGVEVRVSETDVDGNYIFSNIDPGKYRVEVTYAGYAKVILNDVVVLASKMNYANIFMEESSRTLNPVEIVTYKVPLVEKDNTSQGKVMTAEEIQNSAFKSVGSLVGTTAGIASSGGDINIRGSRGDGTNYYIDGVRVSAANLVPTSEIEQLQVVTGGLEARYGDVTGGIISLTTKGPSSKFSGGVELETSRYLDAFGRTEVNGNISGPLWKKKSTNESILGFRLSARYLDILDNNPGYYGDYHYSEDAIRRLEANPVTSIDGNTFSSAEFLKKNDFEHTKANPNNTTKQIDINGKIDARLNSAMDISLSGGYNYSKDRFTPGGWGWANYLNNPYQLNNGYRTSFRFRHRLGSSAKAETSEAEKSNKSSFSDISYSITLGYDRRYTTVQDDRHKNQLFRYGHIGTFENEWIPTFRTDTLIPVQNGFRRVLVDRPFTPSQYNPNLANYNAFDPDTAMGGYTNINGLTTTYNNVWGGLTSNVGQVYNNYSKGQTELFSGNAELSFDFLPKGSDKGRHSIQVGFLYEQRIIRSYGLSPFALWTRARDLQNQDFNGVNLNSPTGDVMKVDIDGVIHDAATYNPILVKNGTGLFFKKIRQLIYGNDTSAWYKYVNIDAIDPDRLSLDMFNAHELVNDRNNIGMNFYGYDYLGNKVGSNVSFNDFFTTNIKEVFGPYDTVRTQSFLVAPFTPNYSSFYIQDKFSYKDIIFRLGIRVDRYDANTKVMKDPYSLYPITQAQDFYDQIGQVKPENVDPQALVYLTSPGGKEVKAFRLGDQWYDKTGTPVNDGRLIFEGQPVNPRFNQIKGTDPDIKIADQFDPNASFEDYKPQVNVMPRIAISFPISDESNFFAHYDVLVQRPYSGNFVSALDYYFFYDQGGVKNNANLKPEKTIDYEVGFQQRLSNSSAIKLSAYYKEMRDMIQRTRILNVQNSGGYYETYGNIDFGTVKGFSIAYDLRRTRNFSLTANYTLQFANGTGSDANSQANVVDKGNNRTLFPLSFDERHAIKVIADYRYGGGKLYNGPQGMGWLLENFGINLTGNVISGRPYTRDAIVGRFGGTGFGSNINAIRLPWNYTIDLRVDKNFTFGGEDAKHPLNLNVFLRVTNLLNTANILNVYKYTGSATDDGYLISSFGDGYVRSNILNTSQEVQSAGRDTQAFLDAYNYALINNGFYAAPRRIYIGMIFNF